MTFILVWWRDSARVWDGPWARKPLGRAWDTIFDEHHCSELLPKPHLVLMLAEAGEVDVMQEQCIPWRKQNELAPARLYGPPQWMG